MRGLLANKNGLLLPHEVDPRGGNLLERSFSARSITNSALIRPKLSLPFVPYFAKARRRLHEADKQGGGAAKSQSVYSAGRNSRPAKDDGHSRRGRRQKDRSVLPFIEGGRGIHETTTRSLSFSAVHRLFGHELESSTFGFAHVRPRPSLPALTLFPCINRRTNDNTTHSSLPSVVARSSPIDHRDQNAQCCSSSLAPKKTSFKAASLVVRHREPLTLRASLMQRVAQPATKPTAKPPRGRPRLSSIERRTSSFGRSSRHAATSFFQLGALN